MYMFTHADLDDDEIEYLAQETYGAHYAIQQERVLRSAARAREECEAKYMAELKEAQQHSRTCSICTENPADSAPPCGHVICSVCIKGLQKPECSKCRGPMAPVKQLFF